MKSSFTTNQACLRLPGSSVPDNSSHDHPNVVPPPKPLRRILAGLAAALAVFALTQPAAQAASYLDTDGATTGFQAANGATYTLSGNYWNPNSSGIGTLAAFVGSLTIGNSASDFNGLSFSISTNQSTAFGAITINSTNASVTLTGGGNNHPGSSWTVATGSTLTTNMNYGGIGGMNWQGANTTFSGGGTINFTTAPGMNARGATITQSGPAVNMQGSSAAGNFPYQANYTLTAGTLNFASAAGASAFVALGGNSGSVTISGGTIDNTSGLARTLDLKGTSSGQGIIKLGGNFTFAGSSNLSFGTTPVTLTTTPQITVADKNLTVGGIISGSSYGITKAGSGTLAISGANTYTGATVVNNGTLKLTGGALSNTAISLTGTGILAVQPGSATTISAGNTATAAAGATLNLGGQTFDMTDGAASTFNLVQGSSFAGPALTITNGATLKFNLGNASADLLAVTKTAAVSGTVNVTIDTTGATSLAPATYPLVTAASGLTGGAWQFTGGGTTQTVTIGGTDYNLTLSASDTAVNLVVASASVTLPTKLAITSVNGGANPTAGAGFGVTVVAQDDTNTAQPVSVDTLVTLNLKTGNGTLGGTMSGTILAGNSLIAISGVTYTKAESGVELTAGGGSLTAGDSAAFTVNAGAAAIISLTSGDAQSKTVGTALASPFAVTVTDASGNPITGTGVTFAIASTPAGATGQSLSATTTTTGSNGQAASTLTLGTKAGGYTVTATSGSLSGSPVTFSTTGTVGAVNAGISSVVASPVILPADGSSASTVTVTLKDLYANPVPGESVALNHTSGAGSPMINTVSGTTDTNGIATFTVTSTSTGNDVFTATDSTASGLAITQTASVNFTLTSAGQSTVSASPPSVVADGATTSTITVTLKDYAGIPVSGHAVNVVKTSGPGTPVISAVSGTTDGSGVATFTVVSTSADAVVFTAMDSTDGNLVITQTATVTFTAGTTSASVSTVTSSPSSVAADGTRTSTITVTLKDANGNPVPGKTVTLASSRGGTDTISAASGASSVAGVVTFTVKSSTQGSAGLSATDTTDSVTITQTATVVFTTLVIGAEQYNPGVGQAGPPSPIDCIGTDLLQTSLSGVTGEVSAQWRSGIYNDGVAYSDNPYVITYALNVVANPLGYDIKEIRVFSGWDAYRSGQSYDILYSFVGSPDTFLPLGTVLTHAGENGAVMTRTYDMSAGSTPDSGTRILTGVAKIRFDFRNNASGYGTVFREFDVTGVATANSSPFDIWVNGTFANGTLTDKNPAHDPDGDGITNFQEFAFGLDPTTGASCNPATPLIGNQFTYTRYADSGLDYTVEYSTDLAGWDTAATTESIGEANANGVQIVTVTVDNPPVDGKLFVRVRAE